ncbi:hypothetical protein MD484_g7426, partial [Candolleomyces efflorescens]
MVEPQLPMAMLYLSALSNNPGFSGASKPSREGHLDLEGQLRRMSKVLDAIVYFLPVSKGHVFALSLEAGGRARIAVAGNDNEHFRPACGRTPVEAIHFIWDALRSIVATSEEKEKRSRVSALLAFLYGRHEAKIQARFDKRKEQCKLFLELAKDPDFQSRCSPEQLKFLSAARKIFRATSVCLEFSKEEAISEKWTYFHYVLQEAQDSYVKKDVTPYSWHTLELKVQNTVAPPRPFDFIHYVDKLLSPSIHAARLHKTTRSDAFQKILQLPLDVICVPTNPAPSKPLNLLSDQEICSFLAHCYGEYAPGDEAVVSEVLETTSAEVRRKIGLYSTLNIEPPHCECTLVHYHLGSLENSAPYPYIAVSKLSCLNCGLYLAACQKYGEQKRDRQSLVAPIRFQTRGRHAEVTPLLALPSGPTTAALDTFVEEDILSTVKEIMKSTADSDGLSPKDRTIRNELGVDDNLDLLSRFLNAVNEDI